MKFLLALVSLATFASAQIPDVIPFGKAAGPLALAAAKTFQVTTSGEDGVTSVKSYPLSPLHSKLELKNAVDLVKINYTVKDPRRPIWITVTVFDENGDRVLEGSNSFNLYKKGNKWMVPEYAGYIFFNLCERHVPVKDTKSATMMDENGNRTSLVVVGGVITIPPWLDGDEWDTLEVTFKNGSVVRYDGTSGKKVTSAQVTQNASVWGIEDLFEGEVQNGVLECSPQPQYGWNPVVEVTLPASEDVVLDIAVREWDEWSNRLFPIARPTKAYITTLDDIRAGKPPTEIEYSPDGNVTEPITVSFGAGTHYMWFQWPEGFAYVPKG